MLFIILGTVLGCRGPLPEAELATDCESLYAQPGAVTAAELSELCAYGCDIAAQGSVEVSEALDLSCVVSVRKDLDVIGEGGVEALESMVSLAEVGGDLSFSSVPKGTSLAGLESLAAIGGSLLMSADSALDIDGLSGLQAIGGHLRADGGETIGLGGLGALEEIGLSLHLSMGSCGQVSGLDALSGLTTIGLDLTIGREVDDGECAPIEVAGLGALSTVDGDVSFGHGVALSVDALGDLTAIGGQLSITDNDHIESLAPFSALEVLESLSLVSTALPDLQGLAPLTSLPGSLVIDDGAGSLAGLESLAAIGGSLSVSSNDLDDFSGLSGLESVAEVAVFHSNTAADFSGLEALHTVGGELRIALGGSEDLTGLSGLTTTGGLKISNNDALTDISALLGLTSAGSVLIRTNPCLSEEHIFDILDELGEAVSGEVSVANNDGPC